jgi:hypothetical protein
MPLFALVLVLAAPPVEAPPDTVVVCPPAWRETLRPWFAHRAAQGHRFKLASNELPAEEIRGVIRDAAKGGHLKYVLLVGDAVPRLNLDRELRARSIPTHFAQAKVNVKFGSEPEIATDNWYADLDDDDVPDVAIGRITADNPEELAAIIRKILAYERTSSHGAWRQRINVVAGVGGFGPIIDGTIETAAKKFLTDGIPPAYDTTMTYGSWRSPYCPDPRQFHDTTLERLNEGCLFWVYIGHGQKTFLDQVRVPGGVHHILACDDVPKLKCSHGAPIALFLACYTGAFDQPQDCLAEEMLRAEGGPVAVYSGSRVTMPYAMAVMGTEMIDEYFQKRPETLGDVLLAAKRRMVADKPSGQSFNRRLLDGLATLLSPHNQLAQERAEHLLLFNLIGDPLLKLDYPEPLSVQSASAVEAGGELEVTCDSPISGRCTVELVCRRDRLRFAPPTREQFDRSGEALSRFMEIYREANNSRWVVQDAQIKEGKLATTLLVPESCRGSCHVRVFVEGKDSSALGSANVFVKERVQEERVQGSEE